MKEAWKPALTGLPKTPYYRGGDIFMPTEPGQREQSPQPAEQRPISADEATRRLEQAARQGEVRRLLKQPNLNTEVRGALERFLAEGGKPFSGGAPTPEETAAAASSAGQGRGSEPPAPPVTGSSPEPDDTLSPEDKRKIEENLIKEQYADRTLRDFVGRYNEGVTGRLGRIKPQFMAFQMRRLQGMLDDPASTINEREAQRLFAYLENKFEEIQNEDQAREQGARNPEDRRVREQIERFMGFLRDPAVLEELKKDSPDLNSESLKDLRKFVEDIVVSSRNEFYPITRIIAGLQTSAHVGNTQETDRIEISEKSRRLLFERMVEKLIGRPDKGSDEAPYKIGSFEMLNLLDEMNATAFNEFGEDTRLSGEKKTFFNYLSELQHVREISHELNRNLHYGEQYKSYVTEHLRSAGLDFMQNELAGVNTVLRLYEKATPNKVKQRQKWLSHGDIREIDDEILDLVKNRGKKLKEGRRVLSDWETDRALRIARIFFAGDQRMAMYTALGDLPSDAVTPDRIGSLPYEFISRSLVPEKMIAQRFYASAGGSKRYMERVFEEKEAETVDEPGKEPKSKFFQLFGLDKRTTMMNVSGAFDSLSHGWRQPLMFFGNIKFKIGEKPTSMLEYLNETSDKYGATNNDPVLGGKGVEGKAKTNLSDEVKPVVLGQRLYLSILAKYPNFDNDLKADIWRKIAILKPSTIASLVPGSVNKDDEVVWEELRKKLYIAEDDRVIADSEHYEGGLDSQFLETEVGNFTKALDIANKEAWLEADYENILKYMGMENLKLSDNERRILQGIIRNGIRHADDLVLAKSTFTYSIDDAPIIAWKKTGERGSGLGDENMLRLLISDHKNISESFGATISVIESPDNMKVLEHFPTAVDKYAEVHGRVSAQEVFNPYILAWVKMASTDQSVELIPSLYSLKTFFDKPTSEMMKFFKSSYLSLDARERYETLTLLAQLRAIGDDVSKVDDKGKRILSQLEESRKKTKSTKLSVILRSMRIIIYLIGPEAAYEFFKIIFPEDINKALQLK